MQKVLHSIHSSPAAVCLKRNKRKLDDVNGKIVIK